MRENKVFYQVSIRKYKYDYNDTRLITFNDPRKAYELYRVYAEQYRAKEQIDKMRECIVLQVVNNTPPHNVTSATIVSCGHDVVDNFTLEPDLLETLERDYLDRHSPPLE